MKLVGILKMTSNETRNILKNIENQLKNYRKYPFYNLDKENLKDLKRRIYGEKMTFFTREAFRKYFDSEKILPMNDYLDYTLCPKEILKTLENCLAFLKDEIIWADDSENYRALKKEFEFEEILELVIEFGSALPYPFNKLFLKYLKMENFIFSNDCSITNNGLTYVFHYPDYNPIFLINKTKDISMFFTIVHEIAHAIFFKYLKKTFYVAKAKPYISETEGYYFEYLASLFLDQKFKQNYQKMICDYSFEQFTQFILKFYLYILSIKCTIKRKKIDLKYLFEKTSIFFDNPLEFEEAFYTLTYDSFYDCSLYSISYLVNLDLQSLDDEKALYCLRNIYKNGNENLSKNLQNNGLKFINGNFSQLQRIKDLHNE